MGLLRVSAGTSIGNQMASVGFGFWERNRPTSLETFSKVTHGDDIIIRLSSAGSTKSKQKYNDHLVVVAKIICIQENNDILPDATWPTRKILPNEEVKNDYRIYFDQSTVKIMPLSKLPASLLDKFHLCKDLNDMAGAEYMK